MALPTVTYKPIKDGSARKRYVVLLDGKPSGVVEHRQHRYLSEFRRLNRSVKRTVKVKAWVATLAFGQRQVTDWSSHSRANAVEMALGKAVEKHYLVEG